MGRAWSESVPATVRDNPAIASAWARGQIRQFEDRYAAGDGDRTVLERAIVAISLKFQVLCRFTAYVAVDRSQTVNQSGSLHQVTQPVEMPEAWVAASSNRAQPPESCRFRAAFPLNGRGLAVPARGNRLRVCRLSTRNRLLPCLSVPLSLPICVRASMMPSCADDFEAPDSTGESTLSCGPPSPCQLPDRFEIGKTFALGGMGRIYEAFDRDLSREVSLKIVEHEELGPETLERWRRQKEMLERLNHPAIPPAVEVGGSGESCWVVTPRFKGQTLAERLSPFRRDTVPGCGVADGRCRRGLTGCTRARRGSP